MTSLSAAVIPDTDSSTTRRRTQAEYRDEQFFLRRLYWSSFGARVTVGLVAWYLTFIVQVEFLRDSAFYEQAGASIAADWLNGQPSRWLAYRRELGTDQYLPLGLIYTIAGFYVLTGGIRALPLLIIAYGALTALVPGMIYRIGRAIGTGPRAARTAAWVVALCPVFALFSGALHKEGLILLCLGLAFYHTVRLQQAFRPRSLMVVILCVFLLIFLRIYLAVIMASILSLGLLLVRSKRSDGAEIAARQIVVVVLFIMAMLAVGVAGEVQELWPKSIDEGFVLIDDYRHGMAISADSGFLPETDITSPAKAIEFLPVGAGYFLVVPLPWQTGSIRQNLAIPDTALWLVLYPVILVGMWNALQRNFSASILLIAATVTLIGFYGLTCGNMGAVYRMRIQVWYLWAPFLGIGWERIRHRPAFERRQRGRAS